MRRLVLVLGVAALAACEPLKDAFTARADVAARAAGQALTVERLSQLAGLSKQVPLQAEALARYGVAVTAVCAELARAIVADAEGATHLVIIEVEGLRDDGEARRVAKAVAESPLVKTAIFGADPNWGRIVSAAGYAGVEFEEEQLSLWMGDLPLYSSGTPQPFDAATASAYLKNNRDIVMKLQFALGNGRCVFWTCDLGYEYVRLNADYTT